MSDGPQTIEKAPISAEDRLMIAGPLMPAEGTVKPRCRLAGKDLIYHQGTDGHPSQPVEHGFSRWLESDEAPYVRNNIKVGEKGQPLDLGWLRDSGVGTIFIVNESGQHRQTYPTEAEVAETAKQVLIVYQYGEAGNGLELLIRPGDSCRFELTPRSTAEGLIIRCECGDGKYSIRAFPR